jgi:PAS domain S-box-containing protein
VVAGEIPNYTLEKRYLRKDGSAVWVDLAVSAVHDRSGEVAYLSGIIEDITARVQAEQALAESEERFRSTFEQAAVGMSHTTPDGHFLRVNQRYCDIVGYTEEELLGMKFQDVTHPDDLDRDLELGDQLEAGLIRSYNREKRYIRKDGAIVWIDLTVSAVRKESGEIAYFAAVLEDITARIEAEQALAESEERFRSTFEQAAVGMAHNTVEGRYLRVNQRYGDIVGYTEDELLEMTFQEITHPEDLDKDLAQAARLIAGEISTYTMEKRYIRKDGGVVWAELTVSVVRDDAGDVKYVIAVIDDVTDRIQAQRALAESEARFRRAVMEAPFPMILHAEDGEILQINRVWTELTGYTPKELPTIEAWLERAYGKDAPVILESVKRLFDLGGRVDEGEFEVRTRSGEVRTWAFSSAPLGRLPDGRRVVLSMAVDVTERRELEAELARAEKMEALGQLAGGVAHDFNNKLTAVIGYASLLLTELEPRDPRSDDLSEIERAAEHMAGITRQLLALSRQQVIQPRELNLNDLITDMQGGLSLIVGADIDLQINLAPAPTPVQVDPSQIQQLVEKLVNNAREAIEQKMASLTAPDAGDVSVGDSSVDDESAGDKAVGHALPSDFDGQIIIQTANRNWDEISRGHRSDMLPNDYVLLSVRDNGVGMGQEVMAHLFEPFFTTKDWTERSGLGLAAAYGIVKQNSGQIQVESEPGVGSVFDVYLPRVE